MLVHGGWQLVYQSACCPSLLGYTRCHSSCAPPPMQAFACFSSALAVAPQHAGTLIAAAALYKSCGLLPEAVSSLEAARKQRPDDAGAGQALAVVLTDLGALHTPLSERSPL